MTEAYLNCIKGKERAMEHVICLAKRGLVMELDSVWDGGEDYEFQIDCILDSWDVMEPNSCKQCRGLQVFLNKAPMATKTQYRKVCHSA